jgi:hypothetical protein
MQTTTSFTRTGASLPRLLPGQTVLVLAVAFLMAPLALVQAAPVDTLCGNRLGYGLNGTVGVFTIAGSTQGNTPSNAPLTAQFDRPTYGALHTLMGTLYFSGTNNDRIWALSRRGQVTVLAGSGNPGDDDNTDPLLATFHEPQGVAIDYVLSRLYIADKRSCLIREILLSGGNQVRTLAGKKGSCGYVDDTNPLQAQFQTPIALAFNAVSSNRKLYIADGTRIRIVNFGVGKSVTTYATVTGVQGLAFDPVARLLFVGALNDGIYKIDIVLGTVTKIATVTRPVAITGDWRNGIIYYCDQATDRVQSMTITGANTNLIAGDNQGFQNSANPLAAKFNNPESLVFDALSGGLFVMDRDNDVIRGIGNVTTACLPQRTPTTSATRTKKRHRTRSHSLTSLGTKSTSADSTASLSSPLTVTPKVSGTVTVRLSDTLSRSRSVRPTPTASLVSSVSRSASGSATASFTADVTGSISKSFSTSTSASDIATASFTAGVTGSISKSFSVSTSDPRSSTSVTRSLSLSKTLSRSRTVTIAATATATLVPSSTVTITPPPTPTPTFTESITPTSTKAATRTRTSTRTRPPTPTKTLTATPSLGHTKSLLITSSSSESVTAAVTPSATLREQAGSSTKVLTADSAPPLYFSAFAQWRGRRLIVDVAASDTFADASILALNWPIEPAATSTEAPSVRVHLQPTLSTNVGFTVGDAPTAVGCSLNPAANVTCGASSGTVLCGAFRILSTQSTLRATATLPASLTTWKSASCDSITVLHTFIALQSLQFVSRPVFSSATSSTCGSASALSFLPSLPDTVATAPCAIITPRADPSSGIVDVTFGRSIACSVSDTRSYEATVGAGIGQEIPCYSASTATACVTVTDFHRACSATADCAGYTTELIDANGIAREIGVSLHRSVAEGTPAYRPSTTGRRLMYHAKQSEASRTCYLTAQELGSSMQVYLAHTALATNVIDVFLTNATTGSRRLVRRCGGAYPFAARSANTGRQLYGRSGRCSTLELCVELASLDAGSLIEVVAPVGMGPGTCSAPLLTVASVSRAPITDDPETGPTPEAPLAVDVPPLFDDLVLPKLALSDKLSASRSTQELRIYVSNALAVGLKVNQNAYACSGDSCGTVSAITMRIDNRVVSECGANASFSRRAGRTGRCDLAYDCGYPYVNVTSAAGLPFSGFVSVTVNVSWILSQPAGGATTADCTAETFLGRLFVIPMSFNSVGGNKGEFNSSNAVRDTFPLAPLQDVARDSRVTTADRLTVVLPHSAVSRIPNELLDAQVGFLPSAFHQSFASLAPTNVSVGMGQAIEALGPNVTFACSADTIFDTFSCRIPTPLTSQRVAVRVQQTDFSVNKITVAFVDAAGNRVGAVTTCGGSFTTPFYFGELGIEGACDTALTCVDVFIPARAVAVIITADANIDPRGCDLALLAMVEFATMPYKRRRLPEDVPEGFFLCASDHALVPRPLLCDGLSWECPDGGDERCSVFQFSARIAGSLLSLAARAAQVDIVEECRRLALINASCGAFTFDPANRRVRADLHRRNSTTHREPTDGICCWEQSYGALH